MTEYVQFLFEWALIICFGAFPAIVLVILVSAAVWGAKTSWEAVLSGNWSRAVLGIPVLAMTGAAALLALDYFDGPDVELPVLEVMQLPARLTDEPLPRTLLVGSYADRWRSLALLQSGAMSEVLVAKSVRKKIGSKWERVNIWSIAKLKTGEGGCEHVFSSLVSFHRKSECVDFIPLASLPEQLGKPHFLVEVEQHYYPQTETAAFYLENGLRGGGRQLFATCKAEWIHSPHMLTAFLVDRRNRSISRKQSECKQQAYSKLASLVDGS